MWLARLGPGRPLSARVSWDTPSRYIHSTCMHNYIYVLKDNYYFFIQFSYTLFFFSFFNEKKKIFKLPFPFLKKLPFPWKNFLFLKKLPFPWKNFHFLFFQALLIFHTIYTLFFIFYWSRVIFKPLFLSYIHLFCLSSSVLIFFSFFLQKISKLDHSCLSRHTIDTLQVYGQEKYLVLHDIDVHNISDALMPNEVKCDVACLVYDASSPSSFEYVARLA